MGVFEKLFKYPLDAFAEGRLVFLSRVPVEVLVLAFAGAAVLVWYLYRRASRSGQSRPSRLLPALRLAALTLLFVLLAVPAIRMTRPPRAVFTAVLVDSSRSMSIADMGAEGAKRSRFDAARQLLSGPDADAILKRLGDVSKVVVYSFDREARRTGDLSALKPAGASTNLFRAVRDMEAELRGLPLASVVLATDGCRNEGGSAEDAARLLKARRVPLYTVGLGNPNPPKDYEVVRVFAPKRVRRNTEIEVYATVRHTDYKQPFDVIVSRGTTPLATRRVEPAAGEDDVERVRIALTPDFEGAATYKVSIPPGPGEAVTDNNSGEFVLEIQDDRLPVLYIEGSPRLEYRFLRRALYRDRDFRLVGLLRLAKDRFYIQGANEAERYLEKGFPNASDPQARQRLFAFEAIILGDIEASYFTPEQLALLEEFVRVRGGGLLMLGGVNSFGLGKYAGTPVGKMLPLEVSPDDPPYSDETFKARATEEGLAHPMLRFVPDAENNRILWEKAQPLIGLTPVRRVKTGASVLLAHETSGLPVLAVQNYGQGRAGAFTSGGSWYWQVSMPASDEFHEKFWKQLVRWLVVGARERLAVETDADVYARGRPVLVKATVREKDLRPVSDATVVAKVTNPLGNSEEIPMDWILSEDGVYQCRYMPTEEGNYSVAVRVQGWDLAPAEAGFEVSEPFVEFSNAGLKADLLKRMAAMTGGRYFDYAEAVGLPDAIAREVKTASAATVAPIDKEIWDMPPVLGALIGVIAVEWFLRRRRGLA
jgi:uncharacterized membrane protein